MEDQGGEPTALGVDALRQLARRDRPQAREADTRRAGLQHVTRRRVAAGGFLSGERVGSYEIVRMLARGGMAVVYLVQAGRHWTARWC